MSLHKPRLRQLHALLLSSGLLFGVLLASGQAQVTTTITPDGTLGTAVTQSGTVHTITGGTRPRNGPNLYHSFDRFNIGTNDTARFNGPAGIVNILSRVTGGQQSVIDGRLQSTIPGANVYLLNPSGILLGPNASLDISGSFHVSTADFLRFADGTTFSAHVGQNSTLTVAPPSAFGFLQSNPAGISIAGSSLQVAEGKTMSVVGGNIEIVGGPLTSSDVPSLAAPSGRINLVSVASSGEVGLHPSGHIPQLDSGTFERLGEIQIAQGAVLDTSGNSGGTTVIRGGRLLIDHGLIAANTLGDVDSPGLGVDVRIRGDVRLTGEAAITSITGLFSQGRGGHIAMVADNITIEGGATLFSLTGGLGPGGDITLMAPTGTVSLNTGGNVGGGGILTSSLPFSSGNVGEIRVEAGHVRLTNGAMISSLGLGSGKGGNVTVAARESVVLSGGNGQGAPSSIASFTAGEPGSISLSAPTITIDGGAVGAPGVFTRARAGYITVKADQQLTLVNGAQITSSTFNDGKGGNIIIEAGRLTLTEGSQITSNSFGSGAGGSVMVTATDTLTLQGHLSGIFAAAQGTDMGAGAAGNIVVRAPRVAMDGGTINASTSGTGNAGNIDVQVGQLTLTGGADVSSSTFGAGHGGNVTVRATESIVITGGSADNQPGLKSLANATGDAGNVFVSAPLLTITDYGRILARTLGDSNAGDIDVRVSRLTLTGGGQIFNGIGDGRGGGNPEGAGRGGNQTVMVTDSLFIAGQSREGFQSGLFSSAQVGSGRAGNLSVFTPRLTMMDGGQISTSTFARGRGGDLRVTATEAIAMSGRGSELPQTGLFSVANSSGEAGSLFISAPRLEVAGGRILTRTLGDSNAGDLEVQVGSLTLSEGGQIFSGTGLFSNSGVIGTGGPGRGGNLTVRATEAISIAGSDQNGFPSGLFSSAQIGSGRAGNLSVFTPLLTLRDGGLIAADTLSTSSGNAGNIAVQAGRLTLSGGAQISSSTSGSGRGGDVTVAATDYIALSRGGTIAASSSGPGDAGDIVIQAGQSFQSRNGAVTTEAEQADGGNIRLTVGSLVELRDSQITATVRTGVGKGGNITIDPQFVVMQGSQVRADAFGGPGGNVRIVAGVFLADPASRVSASSQLGINGVVNIQAPVTSISGAVAPLPQEFAPISELLRDRCAGRLREGRVSRLVLGGRDGVPSEPGSLLLSPLIQTDPTAHREEADMPVRSGQMQGRARYVLAGTLGGLEVECARWTGRQGPTVRHKR